MRTAARELESAASAWRDLGEEVNAATCENEAGRVHYAIRRADWALSADNKESTE
jgi:hypothetical protein